MLEERDSGQPTTGQKILPVPVLLLLRPLDVGLVPYGRGPVLPDAEGILVDAEVVASLGPASDVKDLTVGKELGMGLFGKAVL